MAIHTPTTDTRAMLSTATETKGSSLYRAIGQLDAASAAHDKTSAARDLAMRSLLIYGACHVGSETEGETARDAWQAFTAWAVDVLTPYRFAPGTVKQYAHAAKRCAYHYWSHASNRVSNPDTVAAAAIADLSPFMEPGAGGYKAFAETLDKLPGNRGRKPATTETPDAETPDAETPEVVSVPAMPDKDRVSYLRKSGTLPELVAALNVLATRAALLVSMEGETVSPELSGTVENIAGAVAVLEGAPVRRVAR